MGGRKAISFRTAVALTRGLSAAQSRARAMEQERIEAEREAHMQSLRTALGTPADPSSCAYSTAAAIEESMEEELRRAIPPVSEGEDWGLGIGTWSGPGSGLAGAGAGAAVSGRRGLEVRIWARVRVRVGSG